MDRKQIKSIWAAWQEVQEKKAPVTNKDDDGEGMDPVGKADGDIDNDGDKDASDKYLAKRRKAIGKAMSKESTHDKTEDKSQFMYAAKQAKMDGDKEFVFAGKKYSVEDAYNMKEEDYPVPPKTKKPGDAMEPVNNRTAKLKEGETDKPYPTPEKKKKPGDALEPVNNRTAKLKEGENDKPYPTPEKKKKPGDELEDVKNRTAKLKESELFSEDELSALEERMETAGATAPEGLMDKESPKSKKFAADHQKSNPKFENIPAQAADDASSAGKATKQSAARSGSDNLNNGDPKTPGFKTPGQK